MTKTSITTRHQVGRTIQAMHEGIEMTRRALASEVGISNGHLARIESGERNLTAALGKSITYVIAKQLSGKTS